VKRKRKLAINQKSIIIINNMKLKTTFDNKENKIDVKAYGVPLSKRRELKESTSKLKRSAKSLKRSVKKYMASKMS